ncbi:hypothetical protein CPB83DRAFT_945505 [Crepidotus variabilis]|uniref:Uncharacterized protein n=1 Tax=Crepidotus variabilis TaxID=179855 RepID=A0A9P6E975_9AGAR|nr:hypothetical protein CPB83DRAFT_945505 [Crepidotus variabilis]
MDIADKAAALTLRMSASEFLKRARESNLHDSVVVKWYRFREQWSDIFTEHILSKPRMGMLHKGGAKTCELWGPFQFEVIKRIAGDLASINRATSIIEAEDDIIEGCNYCKDKASRWGRSIASAIGNIEPFSRV